MLVAQYPRSYHVRWAHPDAVFYRLITVYECLRHYVCSAFDNKLHLILEILIQRVSVHMRGYSQPARIFDGP